MRFNNQHPVQQIGKGCRILFVLLLDQFPFVPYPLQNLLFQLVDGNSLILPEFLSAVVAAKAFFLLAALDVVRDEKRAFAVIASAGPTAKCPR